MKIINYEIEMLDVKAADAFIIHIVDESDNDHIILVDAGNYSDGEKIINHLREHYESPKIDLAILTHPDDDHYGGFFYLLEKIKNKDNDAIAIDQFWIHDPGNHIKLADVKYTWKLDNAKEEARSVLNYNDNNLLSLIDALEITRVEPFSEANDTQVYGHSGYQLYILGPTKEYYKSLALSFRNGLLPKANAENTDEDSTVELEEGKVYSKTLADASDDSSKHNQSSLIFSFIPEQNKKYLFMGVKSVSKRTPIPI
ncbi:MAG: MBL fold metallo-hydrolase [Carboxylicivirga sp.]|jgi:hypothetical protein|nr:MBL fold metallo-hydrolase [Carboxylicivirga sp.]